MLNSEFGPVDEGRRSRVTLGIGVEGVSIRLVNETNGVRTVNLFDIELDPDDPDRVLANAETPDEEGLFAVRLPRKIGETKELVIEHRNQALAGATILAAGAVAVGKLWVRHHKRQ